MTVEELAEVIRQGSVWQSWQHPYKSLHRRHQDRYRRIAQAALTALNITEEQAGRGVDVGRAVEAIEDIGVLNHPPRERSRQDALRALGVDKEADSER